MPPSPPPTQPHPLLRRGALVSLLAWYACLVLLFALFPDCDTKEMSDWGAAAFTFVLVPAFALLPPHVLVFSLLALCKRQAVRLNGAVLVVLLVSLLLLMLA